MMPMGVMWGGGLEGGSLRMQQRIDKERKERKKRKKRERIEREMIEPEIITETPARIHYVPNTTPLEPPSEHKRKKPRKEQPPHAAKPEPKTPAEAPPTPKPASRPKPKRETSQQPPAKDQAPDPPKEKARGSKEAKTRKDKDDGPGLGTLLASAALAAGVGYGAYRMYKGRSGRALPAARPVIRKRKEPRPMRVYRTPESDYAGLVRHANHVVRLNIGLKKHAANYERDRHARNPPRGPADVHETVQPGINDVQGYRANHEAVVRRRRHQDDDRGELP